jgi:hypothetical protein
MCARHADHALKLATARCWFLWLFLLLPVHITGHDKAMLLRPGVLDQRWVACVAYQARSLTNQPP